MKKFLLYSVAAFLMAFSSCVTTKAYIGPERDHSTLATIIQGDNNLTIDNKESSESAILIDIDCIRLKGKPKHCDVLPGYHTVEIHHVQKWNDNKTKNILWGLVLGIGCSSLIGEIITHLEGVPVPVAFLGATVGVLLGEYFAEKNTPHQHYLVTFEAEKGKSYTIMAVTDPETFKAEIYVINTETEEIVESDIEPNEDIE